MYDEFMRASQDGAASILQGFITKYPSVRFIRLQWQDYSGILRARMVPPKQLLRSIEARTPVQIGPMAFHCVADNTFLYGLHLLGHHSLIPDWSSLRLSLTSEHNATVMCSVLTTSPTQPMRDSGLCPRRALASVLQRGLERHKMNFLVGFEVEFVIMKKDDQPNLIPASDSLGECAVDGLRSPHFKLIEQAAHTLLDNGVEIQALQSEGQRGQYEIALSPRPPLEAVDELITVHDTLKTIFAAHDLVVTMAPGPVEPRIQWPGQATPRDKYRDPVTGRVIGVVPVETQGTSQPTHLVQPPGRGTGQHTHISISRPDVETQFLAGILHQLPALCAFCMPYDLSYERVQPYMSGTRVAWGTENREVPIRKIRSAHWELRCVDATANMYLALAAILSAGILGVEQWRELRWPDTTLPLSEYRDHREVVPLPRDFNSALNLLEKSSLELGGVMDSRILEHFLLLKRDELSRLARLGPEEVRKLLAKLF